jgi:uncharacterized protein (TIGR02246 family)
MTADEQAIRKLVDDWMTASKADDTATILALMTDDVVFMVPGQPPFGKEAFKPRGSDMKVDGHAEVVELKVLGDRAYLRDKLRIVITPKGASPIVKAGYTLTIVRKNATGQWQLHRDANLLATETA